MSAPQPPAPKAPPIVRPASDARNPVLVAAVALAVVAGLVSFVAIVTFMSITADLTQSSEARLARLEAETAALKAEAAKKGVQMARNFSYHGYRFALPSTWHPDLNGNGAAFFDETGAQVALLTCPPPETGYEAWKFERSEREMTKDGRTYGVELLLGTPDAELYGEDVKGLGDLNILFLTRTGERQADWGASCQLISWSAAGASDDDFRSMYASATVE